VSTLLLHGAFFAFYINGTCLRLDDQQFDDGGGNGETRAAATV